MARNQQVKLFGERTLDHTISKAIEAILRQEVLLGYSTSRP
jgi:hypothetical protein